MLHVGEIALILYLMSSYTRRAALTLALMLSSLPFKVDAQTVSAGDRLNLGLAMKIATEFGEQDWPHMAKASRTTLLIAPDEQAIICLDDAPEGFERQSEDLLDCPIHLTKTPHNPYRIRAFTTFGRTPTVIIGSPYSAEPFALWIGIWLHEHFHQYQMSRPDYRVEAESLGLAEPGDSAGAWMTDYDFPFADKSLNEAFDKVGRTALSALKATDDGALHKGVEAHIHALNDFEAIAGPRSTRWAAFTAWQEGTADAFQIHMLMKTAENAQIFGLDGQKSNFLRTAKRQQAQMESRLRSADLARDKVLAFYALGAAQSQILERLNTDWKTRYRTEPFTLKLLLEQAISRPLGQ
ncbi:hypothetical protein GCM10007972_04050 [Iodidimonas muriae]|uniref:DUF1570 domain-containing protein n=2 Tax=Iodidimonas muriae TaxID=261467 RepID=A0ABQ2L7J1_9PROT|nr:hypothetical protein GCM10007972_04050 [Iodidimonas muriae]